MTSKFDLYRVVFRFHLGSEWMAALPVVEHANTFDVRNAPITAMTVRVTDQAEMIGLLNEVHDRGLTLLSLALVSENGEQV